MSAKFPRGGGSKPILSHPSNAEKVDFYSLYTMVILKIRSLSAKSNRLFIIPQLNINNLQGTQEITCENSKSEISKSRLGSGHQI